MGPGGVEIIDDSPAPPPGAASVTHPGSSVRTGQPNSRR